MADDDNDQQTSSPYTLTNPLIVPEHQISWRRLHSNSPGRPTLVIEPPVSLPQPRTPPIFGSSPRRPNRRNDPHNPIMAVQEGHLSSGNSPQSRPITPLSSDGYGGDIESSPEAANMDDLFVDDDDDGPTPRARKRLTAIKEGSPQEECSDYETAEERSLDGGGDVAEPVVQVQRGRMEPRAMLRIQTGLPLPASPGHRRAISTPTRIEHIDPSALNNGRSNTIRAVSAHDDSASPSGCGTSPEQIYVNYGTSSSDDDFNFVNFPASLLRVSPTRAAEIAATGNASSRAASHGSPTPVRSRSSTATPSAANPVMDLLHHSPRLQRRPALESLRAGTTVPMREPREMIRPEVNSFTYIATVIPNVHTDRLVRARPEILDNTLNGVAAQALLNSERLDVPFMIFRDGRSCMTTSSGGERIYYDNPYQWKYDTLKDLKDIHDFDITHLIAANRPEESEPATPVARPLTKAERKELADLESRSQLRELDMVPIHLTRKEVTRLKDLRDIQGGMLNIESPQKGERTSLIHSANDKARKVLGVFSADRSKDKKEVDSGSIESKQGEKGARKKMSMFMHGRHTSRSMTDVSETVATVATPSRHSIDLLSAQDDQTTPRPRHFLSRRRDHVRKSRSHESNVHDIGASESLSARLHGIRKADVSPSSVAAACHSRYQIGAPLAASRLTGPFTAEPDTNSSRESIASSEYNGDESSIHQGQALHIVPSPERPSPDLFANMGLMEKMKAMKRKREAGSTSSSHSAFTVTNVEEARPRHSVEKLFDPFAGIQDGKSFAEREAQKKKKKKEREEAEKMMRTGIGKGKKIEMKQKPRFEGPITTKTSLSSNAPTEEEREFARELTTKNKALKERLGEGQMF